MSKQRFSLSNIYYFNFCTLKFHVMVEWHSTCSHAPLINRVSTFWTHTISCFFLFCSGCWYRSKRFRLQLRAWGSIAKNGTFDAPFFVQLEYSFWKNKRKSTHKKIMFFIEWTSPWIFTLFLLTLVPMMTEL